MMYEINETHDPNLKSWVESANDLNTDFPIQNLPFCSFRHRSNELGERIGVRLGDFVIDIEELPVQQEFDWWLKSALGPMTLSRLNSIGSRSTTDIREYLLRLFSEEANDVDRKIGERTLVRVSDVEFLPSAKNQKQIPGN